MRALFLVNVGLWKARNSEVEDVIFFMKPRVWKKEIEKYAKAYKVRIIWERSFFRYRHIFSKLLYYTKRILKLTKRISIRAYIKNKYWSKLKYISKKDNIAINKVKTNSNRFALAVPYFGNLNLDNHELQSDLFFFHQSNLAGEDILVMFDLPIDPFDVKKELELNKYQIKDLEVQYEFRKLCKLLE